MAFSSSETHPAKLITLSFLTVIGIGTFLLRLPVASTGHPLSFIDALFMATSGVCVTGLSVIDIGLDLTKFGQLVILSLIQAGGLGIMTFSLFFFLVFGVKTSMTSRLAVPGISRELDMKNLSQALLFVVLMTLSIEILGAVLLFWRFSHYAPAGEALYSSVFHAISAFCNAGFGLYSDSLIPFSGDSLTLFIFIALIVTGGLGFIVIDEIRDGLLAFWKREPFRFSLHTKICLYGTAALIATGTLGIWIFERHNIFSGVPSHIAWVNSLFLAVTSRTAGFSSVETAYLSNGSLFFLIILMFIGGCPGSTAGGIKITSIVVILTLIVSHVRGRTTPTLMGRSFPTSVVAKALGVFAAGFLLINLSTLLFQITETINLSHQVVKGRFLDLFFEATSAFGTVGLSTGVTPHMTPLGKIVLTLLMLAGRVGPLTFGLAIFIRSKKEKRYDYPEEDVLVG